MSHMVLVQAEVDELLKASAEKWLHAQGIDPEDAIRWFYQEVVSCQGMPFGVASTPVAREEAYEIEKSADEVSAVNILSVSGELRDARSEGNKLLGMLLELKADRSLKKAARKAERLRKANGMLRERSGEEGAAFC